MCSNALRLFRTAIASNAIATGDANVHAAAAAAFSTLANDVSCAQWLSTSDVHDALVHIGRCAARDSVRLSVICTLMQLSIGCTRDVGEMLANMHAVAHSTAVDEAIGDAALYWLQQNAQAAHAAFAHAPFLEVLRATANTHDASAHALRLLDPAHKHDGAQ